MATLERLKRRQKGKTYKSPSWYVQYSLNGKRRRVAAFTDRQASQQLANNIEKLKNCRASDIPIPKNLSDAIDSLPERILKHLRNAGLLDEAQTAGARPLSQHLETWQTHLAAKGDTAEHVKQRIGRAGRLLEAAGACWWADIAADRVEEALTHLRDVDDLSVSTVNAYRAAAKQFTGWMYRSGLAAEDPLRYLSRQNPEPHRRCKRRALTQEECSRLLQAAYGGDSDRDGASPETRALLYRTALETGLRFNELKTIKVHHLELERRPPTVTIEAGYSKNRRPDTLPLRKKLADDLRDHCASKQPPDRVFDMWPSAQGARMLKGDLKAAGIPYKDSQGRQADFHALRYTFITNLARSGVHPKTAQTLARHSTMELTMQVYTLVALDTKEEAVNQLPDLEFQNSENVKNTG